MAFPGQRFVLDLEKDEPAPILDDDSSPSSALIGEIQERAPSAAVPSAPKPPSGSGGPQHKRRFQRSTFKQRRAKQTSQSPPQQDAALADNEKRAIDEENRRQLAGMSDAQIQQEKEELMESMDSGLLERFLRRAKIDDSSQDQPGPSSTAKEPEPEKSTTKPTKSVSFDASEPQPPKEPLPSWKPEMTAINEDLPPQTLPEDLHPASEIPHFHFPTPPSNNDNKPMPPLNPSSPTFLSDLQSHYFPNIPHDPGSLSWLQPASTSPEDPAASISAYHPASTVEAVHPASIRFSLTGTIIAPSTALSLPTTLGLHHHGDDPHAAGYTIPEIAILGKSSFPAQRCIAWQVLGRILFRLGRGEFGDRGSVLVEGLWEVIEKEGVVGVMLAEADGAGGGSGQKDKDGGGAAGAGTVKGAGIGKHASAAAWAVEGVWLWQRAGGGDRGVLKEGVIRPR